MTAWLALLAQGYVCARVYDGVPGVADRGPSMSWMRRELSYTPFDGDPAGLDRDQVLALFRQAFRRWGDVTHVDGTTDTASITPCSESDASDVRFTETAPSSVDRLGYGFLDATNENLLVFRKDWPHQNLGYVLAYTTTTYNALTGEILDADIEFNAEDSVFGILDTSASCASDLDCGPSLRCCTDRVCEPMGFCFSANVKDLLNTTVHEVGHFVGLAHSGDEDATMYSTAVPGETIKRTLACDDADALVFKYPAGEENRYCAGADCEPSCAAPEQVDVDVMATVRDRSDGLSGGCSCSGGGHWGWWLGICIAATLRLLWRGRQ
jgi:hypothetical protein